MIFLGKARQRKREAARADLVEKLQARIEDLEAENAELREELDTLSDEQFWKEFWCECE